MKKTPPGFEPGMADLQSADATTQPIVSTDTSENASRDLAFCLALLTRKSPDLALLVERWDALPEALRAGIMAMVKVAHGAAPHPPPLASSPNDPHRPPPLDNTANRRPTR